MHIICKSTFGSSLLISPHLFGCQPSLLTLMRAGSIVCMCVITFVCVCVCVVRASLGVVCVPLCVCCVYVVKVFSYVYTTYTKRHTSSMLVRKIKYTLLPDRS